MSAESGATIAVIDYGAGNLRSIARALAHVAAARPDLTVTVTADPRAIDGAAAVVLPGVGAAGATMARLDASGLLDPIGRAARDGRPFLGVCLGLQLLFDHLDEDDVPGLGVLPGRVRRLPGGRKVPHMGWNTVRPAAAAWPALAGDDAVPAHYYFVHSYYADPDGPATALVAGTTCYGVEFCSALRREHLWATQFHPEKSGPAGLALLAAFVAEVPG